MKSAKSTRPRVLLVIRSILICNKKILLIQRSKDDTHEPNKWEIPGGKLDEGQDLNNAVERELIEEVGIYGQPLSRLAFVDSDITQSSKYRGLPYIRITGLYKCDINNVRLSFEHQDFKWVKFEEALNMDLSEYTRKSLLAWESELLKYLI